MQKLPDGVRLEWNREPFAVVFKPSDFPVVADHGHCLTAWALQALGGKWVPASAARDATAGLVLLSRPGYDRSSVPIRGTYALLITAKDQHEGFPEHVEEALEFFGGLDQEARLVTSTPSGHFGHIATIEMDCCLSGPTAVTPLDAVLAVQELGFAVLRIAKGRSRDVIDPHGQAQNRSQLDVLSGTCVEALRLAPTDADAVQRDLPVKWSSFLSLERSLAEQRVQQETVEFCGLQLLVPSEQLRPRKSSAPLVHTAIECMKTRKGSSVLDLGVGCGALLLAVLAKTEAVGTGVDVDEGAIAACEANAESQLPASKVRNFSVVCVDFTKLDAPEVRAQLHSEGYDVIICNPPYRSTAQQEAYNQASGQHGGYEEGEKTLVAGETGLEMYEAISRCLVNDMLQAQKRLLSPPAPILKLDGSLIFQVEAGSFGRLGGVAKRVAAAIHKASDGKLKFQRIIQDEKQLERAILLKWSWCQTAPDWEPLLWQGLRVLLEQLKGSSHEQRRLLRSGVLPSMVATLFLERSTPEAASAAQDVALLGGSSPRASSGSDGEDGNRMRSSADMRPRAALAALTAAVDGSLFGEKLRAFLGCVVGELTLERLVLLLAGIRRRPSAGSSAGHWITSWYDALLASLRRLQGRSRLQLLRAASEVTESFERWPLVLCAEEHELAKALSTAFATSGQAFLALWRQLHGTRRLQLLFAHHPRLLLPSSRLHRRQAVLWRVHWLLPWLKPSEGIVSSCVAGSECLALLAPRQQRAVHRVGEDLMDILHCLSANPGNAAYSACEEEAAIASSCLSSMCETAGGELPMYLSGDHFLGSGVTPLRDSQAKELLEILIRTPSIAVNPAYVAKLRGCTLFTEAGRSDVTIPLILSSLTVSPKANARGQLAIVVREQAGCPNLSASIDRCWLFQIDARRSVVAHTIDKLCAAGAVLDTVVDPVQHVQVSDTSRARVYNTLVAPLVQEQTYMEKGNSVMTGTKDDQSAGTLVSTPQLTSLPSLFNSVQGQPDFRAVKVFKVLQVPPSGQSASSRAPPNEIARELKMLALAQRHRAILSLHGLVRVPAGWALLTEWCDAGSLSQRLIAEGRQSEGQAMLLQKQLLAGIRHLHQRGIVHRDVKLDHILLHSMSKLVLSGFALAAPLCEAREAAEPVGTVGYMAPEVIRYTPALEPADVFAAGVVLYTLLLGQQPFGAETPAEETKYRTTCTEADYSGLIFQNVTGLCHHLLKSLLEKDPVERPTALAAAEDDWFLMDPKQPIKTDAEAKSPTSPVMGARRRRSGLDMLWRRPARAFSARSTRNQRASSTTSSQDSPVQSLSPQAEQRSRKSSRGLSRLCAWLPFRQRDDMLDCTQLSAVVQ
ncbi:Camk1d, partial [Symbiodinium microadriaticum]